jgi:hypothetical protein
MLLTNPLSKKPVTPPVPTNPNDGYIGGLIFAWHFACCYIAFIGIVYWWLSGKPDSLWGQFRSATAFDEKLGDTVCDGEFGGMFG